MYRTLTPRFNLVYIGLCLALLVSAFTVNPWQQSMTAIGITLPLGVLAGVLQAHAIDSRTADFLAARNAMDVRRALVASLPGTLSIVLLRVCAIAVLVWIVSSSLRHRVFAGVVGFASFSITRDLAVLPAILRLSRGR